MVADAFKREEPKAIAARFQNQTLTQRGIKFLPKAIQDRGITLESSLSDLLTTSDVSGFIFLRDTARVLSVINILFTDAFQRNEFDLKELQSVAKELRDQHRGRKRTQADFARHGTQPDATLEGLAGIARAVGKEGMRFSGDAVRSEQVVMRQQAQEEGFYVAVQAAIYQELGALAASKNQSLPLLENQAAR